MCVNRFHLVADTLTLGDQQLGVVLWRRNNRAVDGDVSRNGVA